MEDDTASIPHVVPAQRFADSYKSWACSGFVFRKSFLNGHRTGAATAGEIPKVVMRQLCRYQHATPCR